jgi:hypothetical protein
MVTVRGPIRAASGSMTSSYTGTFLTPRGDRVT